MAMLRTALGYFDQAVRHGSIRKAAESLNVASSAVNRQLLQLEEEMGVELFERLPRGIRPTAAGEVLLAYVRRWNREAMTLSQRVDELRGGVRGTIRIAAAESITEDILPRALYRLSQRFPLVEYSLISGDNHRITSELFAKEADVVVAFDVTESLKGHVVHAVRSPIGMVCRPDHPLAQARTVSIAEAVNHPLIVPGEAWLKHSGLNHLLSEHHGHARFIARAERPGMLKAMVKAGLGVAFLTHLGVEQDVLEGKLAWVPLAPGAIQPAVISLMTPKGQTLPVSTMALIDLLKDLLSEFADKTPGGEARDS